MWLLVVINKKEIQVLVDLYVVVKQWFAKEQTITLNWTVQLLNIY